jgi:hypothetical protein
VEALELFGAVERAPFLAGVHFVATQLSADGSASRTKRSQNSANSSGNAAIR